MGIGKVISGMVSQKPDKLKVPIIKSRERGVSGLKLSTFTIISKRNVNVAIGPWTNKSKGNKN